MTEYGPAMAISVVEPWLQALRSRQRRDFPDAAEYFDVSPRLIASTLVNKGLLDRNLLAAD